ncbi:MAG TPA: hypothetical protein VKV30_17140 [Candidatus Angelobacter sp.]|nr:hypothetical protein [Candidatus Angelobacter sp.]
MFKFSRLKTALTVVLLLAVCFAEHRSMTLPGAVNAGLVRTSVWGTGASSGDSIKLKVTKTARAGGDSLSLSVPPGTQLASSDSSAQSMVIAGIMGRMIDENTYEPVSRIFLSDSSHRPRIRQPRRSAVLPVVLTGSNRGNAAISAESSGVYILEAYCTEFEKDNPSDSTKFSFGSVDRNLACILDKSDSIQVKQAAIWIYTDGVTYTHLTQKFPLSSSEWQEAKSIIARCGLIN